MNVKKTRLHKPLAVNNSIPLKMLSDKADPVGDTARGEGRYMYGVVRSGPPAVAARSNLGGSAEDTYVVEYLDLAAVVSRTPVFILDPTRENALAHEHVIETVMKNRTIIPMSFGTVFRTDEDVRQVLRSIYPSLQEVLQRMTGKIEFGLKATWDRDRIIEELKNTHAEIRRFHQELMRRQLQSTYFARVQLGRMIDKALADLASDYIRTVYDGLREVCVASSEGRPIGDMMILNASFLIEKEREAEFEAAVHQVAHICGDRLNFKYTGPWPPYNFVSIHLKLEKGKAG
jgi:hypothetical protein